MRFDLNRLLDGAGVSDVVTDDVDLSQYSAGGGFPLGAPVRVTAGPRTGRAWFHSTAPTSCFWKPAVAGALPPSAGK